MNILRWSAVAHRRNNIKQMPCSFDFIKLPPSSLFFFFFIVFSPTPSRLPLQHPASRRAPPQISQLTRFIKANNQEGNIAWSWNLSKRQQLIYRKLRVIITSSIILHILKCSLLSYVKTNKATVKVNVWKSCIYGGSGVFFPVPGLLFLWLQMT